MDALNPIKESGPASLKISSKNPVAAEVEKSRTKIKGISLAGKEISFSRGRNRFSKKWSIIFFSLERDDNPRLLIIQHFSEESNQSRRKKTEKRKIFFIWGNENVLLHFFKRV